ncbi:hypothetical protein AAKU64_003365 [Undibacterium sp. GrIS 1.8]|uniref:hypothetical protein n=1 Tax=Undibacterium sp. GrIS 1.8 TaxID=3143934 RepID=UPI0033924B87
MKTGERFWQLVGMVMLILIIYGLTELYDLNTVQKKQLDSQNELLDRQERLLKNNQWRENLIAVQQVKKAWIEFLPTEKSPTFAKARLLSDIRDLAKGAGVPNLAVTAADAEGGDKTDLSPGAFKAKSTYQTNGDKNKLDVLPSGVQMIKLTVTGRFDPLAFTKLLHSFEEAQRFTVVERAIVRGAQMEIGIRCYWRLDPVLAQEKAEIPSSSKVL